MEREKERRKEKEKEESERWKWPETSQKSRREEKLGAVGTCVGIDPLRVYVNVQSTRTTDD